MLKSFNRFILESKEEESALDDLLNLGLIDYDEYSKQRYLIAPEKHRRAHFELEFDFTWVSQQESEYVEEMLTEWIESGDWTTPKGSWFDLGSLEVDAWEESDFWEEEDEEGNREPKYGTVVMARVDLIFPKEVPEETIDSWMEESLNDRLFSGYGVEFD